jgi:glycosyltransferase involved in cell wall biosynthesis
LKPESNFTIARVIARLNIGGPAIQAILMTDEFRRRGYQALLLTGEVPLGEGSMEYLAQQRGIVPVKIGTMSRKISWSKDLITLWELIKIFRREKPLVVHTHTAKAGTVGRLAAMLTRVPVRVHTFHGHVFHGYFSPLVTRGFLTIERFLARHTDQIIAISNSQKHELADVYAIAPREKVTVIPLGFDLGPFLGVNSANGGFRASLGFADNSVVVGWVGRVTAIKDPALFLDAAARVAPGNPGLRFVVIGDGDLRTACRKRIEAEHLDNTITFAGWQQNLEHIYADLDLIVLTSINEGTPISLLEAMACARAFVATDVGGVRDLMVGPARVQDGFEIFKNGILVPRDQNVLSAAISYLINRPEIRNTMGEAGRAFVRARFSSERLANDLESLYVSLAQPKRRLRLRTKVQGSLASAQAHGCSPAQKELSYRH